MPTQVAQSPLAVRRKAAGLSQLELARRASSDPAHTHTLRRVIIRLESGGHCISKLSDVRSLANVLGCQPLELVIPGQGISCDSVAELDDLTGDRGWRCASDADDLIGAVARSLGVEVGDPAVGAYVRSIVAALETADEKEAA